MKLNKCYKTYKANLKKATKIQKNNPNFVKNMNIIGIDKFKIKDIQKHKSDGYEISFKVIGFLKDYDSIYLYTKDKSFCESLKIGDKIKLEFKLLKIKQYSRWIGRNLYTHKDVILKGIDVL